MYCKIEGANTVASTGLKWNQPQDRPLTIHHLYLYIYMYVLCVYICIYNRILTKAFSTCQLSSKLGAPGKVSIFNVFPRKQLSLKWQLIILQYLWLQLQFSLLSPSRGTTWVESVSANRLVAVSVDTWDRMQSVADIQGMEEWVNGKWNVESENWGFRREFYLRFQHSGTFSCNVKTLTPWLLVILWLTMRELRMSVRLSRNWKLIPKHTSIVLPPPKKKNSSQVHQSGQGRAEAAAKQLGKFQALNHILSKTLFNSQESCTFICIRICVDVDAKVCDVVCINTRNVQSQWT